MYSVATLGPLPPSAHDAAVSAATEFIAGQERLKSGEQRRATIGVRMSGVDLEFNTDGWAGGSLATRLGLCLTILASAEAVGGVDRAELVWTFSNQRWPVETLRDARLRWEATGSPPVGALIGIQERSRVGAPQTFLTRGLGAFVEHEVAVAVGDADDARDALRDLLLIARHALATGPLSGHERMTGVRGPILFGTTPETGVASYRFDIADGQSGSD